MADYDYDDDVFVDALDDENVLFLEAVDQAPITWDYDLREGYLIPEANLVGQVKIALIVSMKGVFPTPDAEPFFLSNTIIQPRIKFNVTRHRHSDLVSRHLTLHFSPTMTVSFPSGRRTLRKISS